MLAWFFRYRQVIVVFMLMVLVGCSRSLPGTAQTTESLPQKEPTKLSNNTDVISATSGTTSTPLSSNAPIAAIFEIGNQQQIAGIGSYCWLEKCIDTEGIATSKNPLQVNSPIEATLQLPLEEDPLALDLFIFQVAEKDELTPKGIYRWWRRPEEEGMPMKLKLTQRQPLSLDMKSGLYVLRLSARWASSGSVEYGFLLQVQ